MSITGLKILVVEDEPVIALALEDLLLDGGAEPLFASSLRDAQALIEETTFDAAVLDVNVHGAKSYSLAGTLQERGVPYIFATGYGDAAHPAEFAGSPTVAKPYSLADIETALAEARAAL